MIYVMVHLLSLCTKGEATNMRVVCDPCMPNLNGIKDSERGGLIQR